MKYIYYSFFTFALLLGSCAQQEHIAKRKNSSTNTVARQKENDSEIQQKDTIVYSTTKEKITGASNTSAHDTLSGIDSVNNINQKLESFILKADYNYGKDLLRPTEPARFLSVDPLTKKYPELTPYQFASNRPIDGVDLDGKEYLNAVVNTTTGVTKITLVRNLDNDENDHQMINVYTTTGATDSQGKEIDKFVGLVTQNLNMTADATGKPSNPNTDPKTFTPAEKAAVGAVNRQIGNAPDQYSSGVIINGKDYNEFYLNYVLSKSQQNNTTPKNAGTTITDDPSADSKAASAAKPTKTTINTTHVTTNPNQAAKVVDDIIKKTPAPKNDNTKPK